MGTAASIPERVDRSTAERLAADAAVVLDRGQFDAHAEPADGCVPRGAFLAAAARSLAAPWREALASEAPAVVVVTGGAGQIAYSLCPLIAAGGVLGPTRRVALRLLDVPPAMKVGVGEASADARKGVRSHEDRDSRVATAVVALAVMLDGA